MGVITGCAISLYKHTVYTSQKLPKLFYNVEKKLTLISIMQLKNKIGSSFKQVMTLLDLLSPSVLITITDIYHTKLKVVCKEIQHSNLIVTSTKYTANK